MSFNRELNNFLKNLEALEIFIETQTKVINPLDKEGLIGEKEIDGTITVLETISDMISKIKGKKENAGEKLDIIQPDNPKVEVLESIGVSLTQNENGSIQLSFSDKNLADTFNKAVKWSDLTNRQTELVYRNSLISLMMYFENLISGIIKRRLKLFPDSFNPNDKTIKYSELLEFENLSDALEYLIDNEVVKIMYGGFKDWIAYIKKSGVELKKVEFLSEAINEAHNRRNLFVHNDGIVNNIYLKKVSKEFIDGLEKGKPINITNEYIIKAIDNVKKYGTLLLFEAWKTYQGSEKDKRLDYCEKLAYEFLIGEKWDLAKVLYEFIYDEISSYGDKTRAQINIWLCQKQLGDFDAIKAEIEKFDASALQTKYHLCISSILEENDKFYELLDKEPYAISEESLKEWPVLSYVRNDERMQKYLNKNNTENEIVYS
ncbi:hypothetical protein IIE26_05105 [Cytobacillus oceanisediminis]|uniref:hypothetical protein n=1 Tax=Cytobacillus oceanisediminis TaxID=665099 RepID=UPI001865097C|nr:hypothetical protein [Cytobacillus oceanisediminis]QOK28050.1 hypothetical protein IIE26_05105 [Cytobacillus oceanisediminis]